MPQPAVELRGRSDALTCSMLSEMQNMHCLTDQGMDDSLSSAACARFSGELFDRGTVKLILPAQKCHNPLSSLENISLHVPSSTSYERTSVFQFNRVVTGGFGALGRYMIQASQGGTTVIQGRSGKVRTNLLLQHQCIIATRGDAALTSDMAFLSTCGRSQGQEFCLVHTSGIVSDRALANQNVGTVTAVFAPKSCAAQIMWRADFSIMPVVAAVVFSSIASLLGSSGQINYAAANAAVNGLCMKKYAAGNPLLSIQWGPWDTLGMAIRNTKVAKKLARIGVGMLDPDVSVIILESVIRSIADASETTGLKH